MHDSAVTYKLNSGFELSSFGEEWTKILLKSRQLKIIFPVGNISLDQA